MTWMNMGYPFLLFILSFSYYFGHTTGVPCEHGEWQCDDGFCIDEASRCDSYPDCVDESDEWNCPSSGCNEGLIECRQSDGSIGCVAEPTNCAVCPAPTSSRDEIKLADEYQETQWFRVGEDIFYRCSEFYRPVSGSYRSVCKADGTWTEFSLRCIELECSLIEAPLNGDVYVERYTVGGIARFSCDYGYEVHGHSISMCMSDGRFEPTEPPICLPVKCPQTSHLNNGYIIHVNQGMDSYSFGTVNHYHCNTGYKPVGPTERRCGGDGEWEGEETYCKELKCEKFPPLDNGRIKYRPSSRQVGSTALFICNRDSDMFPDTDIAICEDSEEWSEQIPQCLKKAMIGPITRGYIYVGGSRRRLRTRMSVIHGTRIKQSCDSNSELYYTTGSLYLLPRTKFYSDNINGTWTPSLPDCVFKRCNTDDYLLHRFAFADGTPAVGKVEHNTPLRTFCKDRYDFEDEWQEIPASSICLKGRINDVPKCVPAFCSIQLDRSALYLDKGSAELVEDLGRIPHRTAVFFKCKNWRDYELYLDDYLPEVSDTCYFGEWKKGRQPICKEKRCFLKVYAGAKFLNRRNGVEYTSSIHVESGTDVQIECESGYRIVDEDEMPVTFEDAETFSSCSKGKWSNAFKCTPEPCQLVYDDTHMAYYTRQNLLVPNSEVMHGVTVVASCKDDFRLKGGENRVESFSASCSKGNWSSTIIEECIERPCRLRLNDGAGYWTVVDGIKEFINESKEISGGKRVYIHCHEGYRDELQKGDPVPGEDKYADCENGNWNPVYVCKPKPCGIPGYPIINGYVKVYRTQTKITQKRVEHDTTVKVKCNQDFELSLNGEPIEDFRSQCRLGAFRPELFPICIEKRCNLEIYNGAVFSDLQTGMKYNESTRVESGTDIKIICETGYIMVNNHNQSVILDSGERFSTCSKGLWSKILKCMPEKNSTTAESTSSSLNVSTSGSPQINDHEEANGTDTTPPSTASTVSFARKMTETSTGRAHLNLSTTVKDDAANPEEVERVKTTTPTEFDGTNASSEDKMGEPKKYKGCKLPSSNIEISHDPHGYTPGEMVPHGESVIIACVDDLYEQTDNHTFTCYNGNWSDEMPKCEKGCKLPSSNIEISRDSSVYTPGEMVPHGERVIIACADDLYEQTENLTFTCNDGDWSDEMPNCNKGLNYDAENECDIDDGNAEQQFDGSTNYYITCNNGYELNHNAIFYRCENGLLFPKADEFGADISSNESAKCQPGDCYLPGTLPVGMKVQDKQNTYISAGSRVQHTEYVYFECPEVHEPQKRLFQCNAGTWSPVGGAWKAESYSSKTLACRKAICAPACKGVCIRDGYCHCGEKQYGHSCEKTFCHLPSNVKLKPSLALYNDTHAFHNVECSDQALKYRGPLPLKCHSNGTWNGDTNCVNERQVYYLHLIIYRPREEIGYRPERERTIRLTSRSTQTGPDILNLDSSFNQRHERLDIFSFTARKLQHIDNIVFSSPYIQTVWLYRIKLELRDRATVYLLNVTQYLSPSEISVSSPWKLEFENVFDYQRDIIPIFLRNYHRSWMPVRQEREIESTEECMQRCVLEKEFTCASILYQAERKQHYCVTLGYMRLEYPKYFVTRNFLESTYNFLYTRRYGYLL